MRKSVRGIGIVWILAGISLGVIGILVGSFLDLSLAKTIYHENNLFGKVVGYIGSLPGYVVFGFAGVFLGRYFLSEEKKVWHILGYVAKYGFPLIVGLIYGYDVLKDSFGTLVGLGGGAVLVFLLDFFLSYLLKNVTSPKEDFKDALILLFAFVFGLGLTLLLKHFIIRPRYLYLATLENTDEFRAWYDFSSTLLKDHPELDHDLVASAPSGHTMLSALGLGSVLLAKNHKKTQGKEWIFSLVSLLWTLFVAIGRMSDGHHFLSDISWSMLLGFGLIGFFAFALGHSYPEFEKNAEQRRIYRWNEALISRKENFDTILVSQRSFQMMRRKNARLHVKSKTTLCVRRTHKGGSIKIGNTYRRLRVKSCSNPNT